ncbi:MAG TPA: hypothetical protein VGC63_00045 [Solirubrobacterales bacterium]|jgi:hypothetical protein
MNKGRTRARAFGFSLVMALGLIASMAAGAQASEKSWLVSGADIASNQLVEVSAHKEFILDVEKENNLEILCLRVSGDDVLLVASTTTATGKLLFSECDVYQNGVLSTACSPPNIAEPITVSSKSKLILSGGKNYILFEPEVAGGNLAQIKFKPPCSLPETNNVKGTFVAECLKASTLEAVDCKQEEQTHLLQQAPAASFAEDKITYGTKEARLLGVAALQLTSGAAWCGHV